jgi:DNA primase
MTHTDASTKRQIEVEHEGTHVMPGIDFNRLRSEITMERVLAQLNFQPTQRTGNQLHGPCPVHGSTSATSRSLSVNLDSGRYYCHKCGSHGNQLELWAAVNRIPIYEAARDLCRALGHEVPWIERW